MNFRLVFGVIRPPHHQILSNCLTPIKNMLKNYCTNLSFVVING